MNAKKIIPSRRRLTFFLVIIFLIAIFFVGYTFYYIPSNQNIVHKNAFLILNNISRNIKERNDYLQAAFGNILKNDTGYRVTKSQLNKQKKLDLYKLEGKVFIDKHGPNADSLVKAPNPAAVYLAGIYSDSLLYLSSDSSNVAGWIYVPAQNFITPSIASQKKELFESYLLLHNHTSLIYADEELGINKSIAADSLLADKKDALFAGVKDIELKGIKYKMFYFPFRLGSEDVQICGFLKNDIYFKKTHQAPVAFVYSIIVILLLLLIAMPLTKFYLMGKDEQVSFTDFILAVLSFFMGSAIITIIIIQVLLLLAADIRLKDNLKSLSEQIEKSFNTEVKKIYLQLHALDTMIKNNVLTEASYSMHPADKMNVSDIVKDYFKKHPKDTSLYYNFNRITWVDKDGNQDLKGQIDTAPISFTNVSSRNYFKIFNHSPGYPVPGLDGAMFGFEPVNSLTNGDFNIIISEKNKIGAEWVTTISAPMYSVLRTILPPGYGFCIADEDGKVLLHSETNRSLQENIIENTDPSRPITEAIKSRQESFFASLNLYGKNNAVNIKPIGVLPLHLVTFYDKGYIVPVNMRILSFSLVFCCITFGICLLMWFGLRRKKRKISINLSGPMNMLKWILPKNSNLEFYVLGIFFLLTNLVLQILMIFSFKWLGISNYAVLLLTVMMPVNIYTGLFVINYRVRKDMPVSDYRHVLPSNRRVITYILFQLFINLFIWSVSNVSDYRVQPHFIYFTVLFNIFLWLIFLLPAGSFNFLQRRPRQFQNQYALYATLLILSVTAWPASLYTWYAHNQEITQSVKKEQLYLADALRQRADNSHSYYKELLLLDPPENYIDTLQLSAGIYTIYKDKISVTEHNNHSKDPSFIFEQFYFSIANEIGNNYYDPLLIPSLQDSATGNVWHWSKINPQDSEKKTGSTEKNDGEEKIYFTYHLYAHPEADSNNHFKRNTRKALLITSTFPSRYIFIKPSREGFLLLLLVAGVIYGLYRLLKYISYHLFLLKFIGGANDTDATKKEKLLELYRQYQSYRDSVGQPVGLTEKDVLDLQNEDDQYKLSAERADEYLLEKTMFTAMEKYSHFFEFIWNKFSPREKFLLLNYAQNSFINFKNTEAITHLLQAGIFNVKDEELKIFSVSFRSYVLKQKSSEEMMQLKTELRQESTWQSFRVPLLITILGVALFILITQEQTFQKITAILTGLTTAFSLLVKFFTDGGSLFSSKK